MSTNATKRPAAGAAVQGHVPAARSGASGSSTSLTALMAAEVLKLRRSSVWVVALVLPVLAIVSGTVNFLLNQGALRHTWDSYASQVLLFYALFFCSLGIALLAASSWRPEHRSSTWNLVATTPAGAARVVVAKTLVVSLPLVAMQIVVLTLTWAVGACLGLGLLPPVPFVIGNLLVLLSAQPLVALQSLLSLRMQSFAAPVAVCFLGVVVGVALVMQGSPLASLWPPSLVTRALTLGSTSVSTAGSLDAASLVPLVGGAGFSGAVCWGLLLVTAQRRRELR